MLPNPYIVQNEDITKHLDKINYNTVTFGTFFDKEDAKSHYSNKTGVLLINDKKYINGMKHPNGFTFYTLSSVVADFYEMDLTNVENFAFSHNIKYSRKEKLEKLKNFDI